MGISNTKLTTKSDKNNQDYYVFNGMVNGIKLNFNIFINKSGTDTIYKLSYKDNDGKWVNNSASARIDGDSYCLGCFEINGNYYEIILRYDSDSSSFTKAEVHLRNEMIESASKIAECLSDYEKSQITTDSVMSWAIQFGKDAQFMLEETAHFIDKIYFSKSKVKEILEKWILELKKDFDSWDSFLKDVLFINTQNGNDGEEKSQNAFYRIISDIIKDKTDGKSIDDYKEETKKVYVYADDILASGKTLREGVVNSIKELDKRYCCWIICCHSIQKTKTLNSIVKEVTGSFEDSIFKDNLKKNFRCEYMIENGSRNGGKNDYMNQLFNCIEPLDSDLSREVMSSNEMFGSVDSSVDDPVHLLTDSEIGEERFFTNYENRKRYTELILKASNMLLEEFLEEFRKKNSKKGYKEYKPLGITNASDKSLGLGTLFITWRNIPNNCPYAFWGDINGWKPLCPRNKTK